MNNQDTPEEKKKKPNYSIIIGMIFIVMCGVLVFNRYSSVRSSPDSSGYIGLIITIVVLAVLINLTIKGIKGVVSKKEPKDE